MNCLITCLFRVTCSILCLTCASELCFAAQAPTASTYSRTSEHEVEDPSTAETDVDEPDESDSVVSAVTEPVYGVCIIPHLTRYYELTDHVAVKEFGLFECNRKDCVLSRSGSLFSLSRPYLAQAREIFESYIADDIARHNDPAKPLVYTSFGSGGLLQDFMIMMQLVRRGFKKLVIHCIDPMYEQTKDYMMRKGGRVDHGIVYVHCDDRVEDWVIQRLIAFGLFAQKADVAVSAYCYGDALSYCLACDKDPQRKAQVVVSVDMILSRASSFFLPLFKRIVTEGTSKDARLYVLTNLQHTSISMFIGDNVNCLVQEYDLTPASVFKCYQDIAYKVFFDDEYWKAYRERLLQQDGPRRSSIKIDAERKTTEGV